MKIKLPVTIYKLVIYNLLYSLKQFKLRTYNNKSLQQAVTAQQ